jgi:hypothetical protein
LEISSDDDLGFACFCFFAAGLPLDERDSIEGAGSGRGVDVSTEFLHSAIKD